MDYVNHSAFFMAAVDDVELTFDGLEGGKIGKIFEARWWDPQNLSDGVPLCSREISDIARAAVAVRAESP